jgi:hypothetical protein
VAQLTQGTLISLDGKAESAKFEAEQPTKSTDWGGIPELWKQIFPPQICQVLLQARQSSL